MSPRVMTPTSRLLASRTGKPAIAVPVEFRHGADQGEMIAQGHDFAAHPLFRRIVDVAAVQRGDDVFDADNAHQHVIGQDRHAGDAVGLHQMLNRAQGIGRRGGDGRAGHCVAHAQFKHQHLGKGNLPLLTRIRGFFDRRRGPYPSRLPVFNVFSGTPAGLRRPGQPRVQDFKALVVTGVLHHPVSRLLFFV